MSQFRVIGLMSGSSLDGVDLAYCVFEKKENQWSFDIEYSSCTPYTTQWKHKLQSARSLSGKELWQLHADLSHLYASYINTFIAEFELTGKVDLIGSHGHTIFHFPEQHFTTQIADGAAIAALTGIPVVCDMRSSDIALGGQGTPIVPIGDLLLFRDYPYLLNIGGIANISIKRDEGILAFDICAANQVLDHYAAQAGLAYDKNGQLALVGKLHSQLYERLNQLPYYQRSHPKSLDNGYSKDIVIPLIDSYQLSVEDKLHTYCEHIAYQINTQISRVGSKHAGEKLLITGGGALNKYLVSRISAHTTARVEVPSEQIVQYKEALVMAFMAVLRYTQQPNVLRSVTGAERDSIGGALYLP